jgi:DNA-directed RNA polymerase specialized sigma24 family protein
VTGFPQVPEPFEAFVARRHAALLASALLLTGDRGTAEDAVARTLARARLHWRRLAGSGDPAAGVTRLLVRAATGRGAGRRAGQVVEEAPDDSAVARALRDLDPPTRAATVLRWYEGRTAEESAPLLGVAAEVARARADTGRDALLAALGEAAPGGAAVERRLSAALAALAEAPGPWPPDARAAAADARSRVRRGAVRLAGVLLAAAAVVAVAVPLTRALPEPLPADAAPVSSSAAPSLPPPRAVVLAGPARGSLAGDAAFLAAAARADWGAQSAPPPAEREVVLATDTPDGRVALVVGRVDDDFRGVWLTGPVGAAAEDLEVRLPRGLGRDRPLSLVLGGPGPATLVVVAAPGDRVEVSPRLVAGPRGTVGRSWEEAPALDGVAVVPVRTTLDGTGVSVRVSREGRPVHRSGADWPGAGRAGSGEVPPVAVLRPVPAPPDERLVEAAVRALAVPLGAEPAVLQPAVLWSGPLPAGGRPGTVAVVAARSPGGSLVLTTWVAAGSGPVACGTQTPPGNADVARLTVARVCALPAPGGGPAEDRWLVLTAPAGAASADVLDGPGRLLATLVLTDGSAVVPLPDGGRTVVIRTGDGRALGLTAVAPAATQPFGDYGEGAVG